MALLVDNTRCRRGPSGLTFLLPEGAKEALLERLARQSLGWGARGFFGRFRVSGVLPSSMLRL